MNLKRRKNINNRIKWFRLKAAPLIMASVLSGVVMPMEQAKAQTPRPVINRFSGLTTRGFIGNRFEAAVGAGPGFQSLGSAMQFQRQMRREMRQSNNTAPFAALAGGLIGGAAGTLAIPLVPGMALGGSVAFPLFLDIPLLGLVVIQTGLGVAFAAASGVASIVPFMSGIVGPIYGLGTTVMSVANGIVSAPVTFGISLILFPVSYAITGVIQGVLGPVVSAATLGTGPLGFAFGVAVTELVYGTTGPMQSVITSLLAAVLAFPLYVATGSIITVPISLVFAPFIGPVAGALFGTMAGPSLFNRILRNRDVDINGGVKPSYDFSPNALGLSRRWQLANMIRESNRHTDLSFQEKREARKDIRDAGPFVTKREYQDVFSALTQEAADPSSTIQQRLDRKNDNVYLPSILNPDLSRAEARDIRELGQEVRKYERRGLSGSLSNRELAGLERKDAILNKLVELESYLTNAEIRQINRQLERADLVSEREYRQIWREMTRAAAPERERNNRRDTDEQDINLRPLQRRVNQLERNMLTEDDLRPIQRQLRRDRDINANLSISPQFTRNIQRRDVNIDPSFNRDITRNITRNHEFGVAMINSAGAVFSSLSEGFFGIANTAFQAAKTDIAAFFLSPARQRVLMPSISNAIYGMSIGTGLALQGAFGPEGLFTDVGTDAYYTIKALNSNAGAI
jgi:hypothetical protein